MLTDHVGTNSVRQINGQPLSSVQKINFISVPLKPCIWVKTLAWFPEQAAGTKVQRHIGTQAQRTKQKTSFLVFTLCIFVSLLTFVTLSSVTLSLFSYSNS